MGSEVILRGNVSFHLAPVDTPRPNAPNIAPGVVWALFGDSYWTDDGVTWTRETAYDDETILNEPQTVGDFLMSSNQMLAGTVKNFRAEALMRAFNSNPVTVTPPTSTNVGFREMSLDSGISVRKFAMLCRVDGSPYDAPDVHTPGFRTEIYFPRCGERGSFESVLSAKGSSMTPVMFKSFKSNVAANDNSIRMTDLATS